MDRALISNTRERQAFWKVEDFIKCFESSISMKAVKSAQEANRHFVDNGDYSDEEKKNDHKRDASGDRSESSKRRRVL